MRAWASVLISDTDAGRIISGVWWDAAPFSCIVCQAAGRRRLRRVWVSAFAVFRLCAVTSPHLTAPRLTPHAFVFSLPQVSSYGTKKKKLTRTLRWDLSLWSFIPVHTFVAALSCVSAPDVGWPRQVLCDVVSQESGAVYPLTLSATDVITACFFVFFQVRNQFVHWFHFVFMLSQKPYNQVPEKALNYFLFFKC